MSELSTKAVNELFVSGITSDNPSLVKQAQQAVNDFTRVKMREDGFWRRILPPLPISNDELDRQVDTDKNVKVVDKEPNSPAAISIPYAALPMNRYIRGPRYRVMFDRIVTPRFTKDISELRTWDMDIRQVLSDNAIKDMLAEEDGKAIRATNTLLVGPDATVPETGTIQWRSFPDEITRFSVPDALKIMPETPSHLEVATALINNVTVKDFFKWTRDEVGGDLAEEIVRQGWAERTWFGVRFMITIKRDLVPDSTFFFYAEPKFLGKFFVLEDTTMAIERKFYFLEFFAYEEIGSAIGNVAAIARVDFNSGSSEAP